MKSKVLKLLYTTKLTYREIASLVGCTYQYVGKIAIQNGFKRRKYNRDDFTVVCKNKYTKKKYQEKKKGTLFTIKFEDIVWESVCPISGISLDYFSEKSKPNSPAFMLKDLNLGYVKNNVLIVAKHCLSTKLAV